MADLADYFRTMARNNRWSNHRLHRACAGIASAEYFRDRGAFFRSIHGALNHILLVDQNYLAVLQGLDVDPLPLNHVLRPDLATLTAAQEACDRGLIAFCDRLTAVELERSTRWTGSNGDMCEDPVHIVLAHLFLHQIHHRGQVHNLLTTGRFAAPQLDEFLLSHDAPLRKDDLHELGLSERAGAARQGAPDGSAKRDAWQRLKIGERCPFDGERSDANEYWDKIATLSISTLYLHKIQTYRGYSVLVFDPRHVTTLIELSDSERTAFFSDLCRAQKGMQSVLKPDHFNVECLGNQVPHLHWHLIPRYKNDGRWGLPVWMTSESELTRLSLAPEERATLVQDIRKALGL